MQYTVGLATNVTVKFISVSNVTIPTEDEFASYLLDTATYMLGLDRPPPVMSTSYGCDEENVSQKLAQYVSCPCDSAVYAGDSLHDLSAENYAHRTQPLAHVVYPCSSAQAMVVSPASITQMRRVQHSYQPFLGVALSECLPRRVVVTY